jgi:hypothetical protein
MPGGGPSSTTVFFPGGRWTQAAWTIGFMRYRFEAPGVAVRWRRFSSGLPFYWEGSWVSSADFAFPGWLYASLEFSPPFDTSIRITPIPFP